jgi:N-acetylneuraminic acid mutarotase
VIVDHTLYVIGGWALHGGMNDNTWHGTMLTADLTQPVLAWQSVPVPFQVRAHGLAALSGKLYVLGGLDPDGSTDAVHRYDLATGHWSDGPALPKDNLTSRAAVWHGRLYANGADGNLYRLAADEQSWELAGAVQFPRLFHEMVSSERGPLVLGGIPDNGRGGRVRLIELLSPEPTPAGVIWTLDAESRAKSRQGAFVWSQQLFVFGGNTSLNQHDFAAQNFVNDAWRLDLGALEWRSVPELPVARQSMQALVVGADQARALVLGGFGMAASGLSSHADVYEYAIAERQWTALPKQRLPEGRSQFGVAEHHGAIWIFGGMSFDAAREKDDQIRYTRQVLKLDLRQPGRAVEDAGITLLESRRAFAGALLNGSYFLVGGLKEGFEPASSCEAIDLSEKRSRGMPCPSQHRLDAELVAIAGKLYLVGGSVAGTGPERQATRSIEAYDPSSQRWSILPGVVPLDSVDQLRAFAFKDQLLLYTARANDAHVSVALLDPAALAAGRRDFVRMQVDKPSAPR